MFFSNKLITNLHFHSFPRTTYFNFPEKVNVPFVADAAEHEASATASNTTNAAGTVDVVRDEVGKVIVDDVFCLKNDSVKMLLSDYSQIGPLTNLLMRCFCFMYYCGGFGLWVLCCAL